MHFFLDTANLDEIRDAWDMGVIGGVTTNPSLVSKEGLDFTELLKAIAEIVEGPISAEVIALDAQGMITEARELVTLSPNIVIKVPMTEEGLKAVKTLSRDGINTNVTLIFTPIQALLAARAGATYVSPFVGRLDDIGEMGLQLVEDICDILSLHDLNTKVIVASVRNPVHVLQAAKLGADYATVPFKVLQQLFKHPLTDAGIDKFLADWEKMKI